MLAIGTHHHSWAGVVAYIKVRSLANDVKTTCVSGCVPAQWAVRLGATHLRRRFRQTLPKC